jgi:hypothetical protein
MAELIETENDVGGLSSKVYYVIARVLRSLGSIR